MASKGWILFLYLLGFLRLSSSIRDNSLIHEPLIGWKGEVYNPGAVVTENDVVVDAIVDIIGSDAPQSGQRERWVQQISWKPRAFLFRNFLDEAEADYLVNLAMPHLKSSTTVDRASVDHPKSSYRTSYGMFIRRNHNDAIGRIHKRIADWTHVPPIYHEDLQILRYTAGQEFKPHYDVLPMDEDGKRIATVIVYLNDCEEGGETTFTMNSDWSNPQLAEKYGPWSDCAAGKVSVKARKGDALLFYSLTPDGKTDKNSEHAGCPVANDGVKWTATFWLHTHPFRHDGFKDPKDELEMSDAGDCRDFSPGCADRKDRCESNSIFMMGDLEGQGAQGHCRETCGVCQVCASDDRDCYLKNREKAGYLNLEELWPEGGTRSQPAKPPIFQEKTR